MSHTTTFPGFRRKKQAKDGKPSIDNDGLSLLDNFKTDKGFDENGEPIGDGGESLERPAGKFPVPVA